MEWKTGNYHLYNIQELQYFYDRGVSDIIHKAILGSITKTYADKLRLHRGEYEWSDAGGMIRIYAHTILHLLFKSINPATRIGVSNLEYEIEKSNLSKFGKNIKDLLDENYSKYPIIIDKGENHEYC